MQRGRITALEAGSLPAPELKEYSFRDLPVPPLLGMGVNLPIGISRALQVGISWVGADVSDISVAATMCAARALDGVVDILALPPGADAYQRVALDNCGC